MVVVSQTSSLHAHAQVHTRTHTHTHTHTHTVTHTPAPVVLKFPKDTRVQEGESVLFHVEVTGSPQPQVKWYHNGEEVVAGYSKELSEDGSLIMPSVEPKHSGIYQLVAHNAAGRVEREVKLKVDREEDEVVDSYAVVPASVSIPVSSFGSYVEQKHSGNNKPFKDEYDVRCMECPTILHVYIHIYHIDMWIYNRHTYICKCI